MISNFERLIALRYLRSRRREGFVSVITGFSLVGIALGVATLIVVLAVMAGVKTELLARIIGVSPHVMVYSAESPRLYDYDVMASSLAKNKDVIAASPMVEGQVIVSANTITSYAIIQGVREEDLLKKELFQNAMPDPKPFNGGVYIGKRLAEKMGLTVGQNVTFISPDGRATPAGSMPRIKAYTVAGIFEIGMIEYDMGLIYMPLEEAQIFFKHRDMGMTFDENGNEMAEPEPNYSVSGIELTLKNPEDARGFAREMSVDFPTARFVDWQSQRESLFAALAMQRNMMVVVLTLIIIVASFTLISGLVMLVQGKAQDIAILRTMGASRASVQRIFIFAGTLTGMLGTLVGVLLGVLLASNIASIQHFIERAFNVDLFGGGFYFFSTLPARLYASDVAVVAGLAILLSFFATIYPARRAAKMEPVEALRYG